MLLTTGGKRGILKEKVLTGDVMKNKQWIAIALAAFCLAGCGGTNAKEKNVGDPSIQALTPSEGETVVLVNGDMEDFISRYEKGASDEYVTHTDNFAPVGVELSWTAEGAPTEYVVLVDTDKSFSSPATYTVSENRVVIEDLFVNYTYYWKVTAKYETEEKTSKYFNFSTANTPRTIAIEGVSNARDIGGKITTSGKKVKQGMAFRGAYLDEIKPAGKVKALETYGIKTDLDLRKAQEGTAGSASPLGETVRYINYSCPYYWGGDSGINNPNNHENLANAIRVFADKANYPIFFHCSVGRDRTSMVAMLIEGILGVSEDDVFIDYETSAFSYRGTLDGTSMSHMVNTFMTTVSSLWSYTGERELQAACETFLLSIGMTQAEIDSIRSILLED